MNSKLEKVASKPPINHGKAFLRPVFWSCVTPSLFKAKGYVLNNSCSLSKILETKNYLGEFFLP